MAQNLYSEPLLNRIIKDFKQQKQESFIINQAPINKPTELLLANLLENIEASHAAIYLLNEEEKGNPFFEKSEVFATREEAKSNFQGSIEEVFVYACFKAEENLEIEKNSVNKILKKCGLTDFFLCDIALFPIKYNNDCIGVLNILPDKKLEEYAIGLTEQYLELNATSIAAENASRKLNAMFNDYNRLSESFFVLDDEVVELSNAIDKYLERQAN